MLSRTRRILAAGVVVVVVAVAAALFTFHQNSSALWNIVRQQCLPGQENRGNPAPCQQVNVAEGYVTLKDINGPLQYLLMPIARIHGIESPEVLQPTTPNFFWLAWQQRQLLANKRGSPIADRALSLTLNSPTGRTQDQLHIHISCLRTDVRREIDRWSGGLTAQWQPKMLSGKTWYVRAITAAELYHVSPFMRLHDELPQAKENMAKFGLALVALPSGNLALLAIERNLWTLNRASAEEIQDHGCAIL
ncbi:CDP-diacylglycerol diphosphatase [Enterobacterales bacterium CwR94]|nr:CDP-diacylglycerol diphosphatase [Enterobacterales bacterium CwR94]